MTTTQRLGLWLAFIGLDPETAAVLGAVARGTVVAAVLLTVAAIALHSLAGPAGVALGMLGLGVVLVGVVTWGRA